MLVLCHNVLVINENKDEIFKINMLLHSVVVTEKPHANRNSLTQYHICQAYGHKRNYRNKQPTALNASIIYVQQRS